MTVEPICPRPNHEGEAAGIDIDGVAEDRSTVIERLDRNQVVPSSNQRIVFAALYFKVVVVDLLKIQRVYPDRDDSEDEQLAFKDEPLAPALRKRPGRHKAGQGPDHMTEKRAFLNFVPCFGCGTIQYRRYISFHRLGPVEETDQMGQGGQVQDQRFANSTSAPPRFAYPADRT